MNLEELLDEYRRVIINTLSGYERTAAIMDRTLVAGGGPSTTGVRTLVERNTFGAPSLSRHDPEAALRLYGDRKLHPLMKQGDVCSYRSGDWPDNHSCARKNEHVSRHTCWCGTLHDLGADYTGRWART